MRELLSTEHEIPSLATRQYGVVASRQLDLSANAIATRNGWRPSWPAVITLC